MSVVEFNNKGKRAWDIVPYKLNDLAKIGQFFKEHYKGSGSYGSMGYFNWKICDNATAPGIINLIKDVGKIVAITSLTPKSLLLKGIKVKAGEIGDAYTDSNHKGQGMFPALANQSMVDGANIGVDLIYATPDQSSPSLPVFIKKLNYDVLNGISLHSMSFKINIKSYLSTKMHWTLSTSLGLFFSFFSYFFYLFKSISIRKKKDIIVEMSDDIPSDWNGFWEEVRRNYDFIFERDSKTMVWRYIENPNKYKFLILREGDKICGYLIYRVVSNESDTSIIIADYLTLTGNSSSIKILIDKLLKEAFKLGVSSIYSWCVKKSPYYNIFKSYGFLRRSNISLVCYQNDFAKGIKGINSCHFVIGDTDNV